MAKIPRTIKPVRMDNYGRPLYDLEREEEDQPWMLFMAPMSDGGLDSLMQNYKLGSPLGVPPGMQPGYAQVPIARTPGQGIMPYNPIMAGPQTQEGLSVRMTYTAQDGTVAQVSISTPSDAYNQQFDEGFKQMYGQIGELIGQMMQGRSDGYKAKSGQNGISDYVSGRRGGYNGRQGRGSYGKGKGGK